MTKKWIFNVLFRIGFTAVFAAGVTSYGVYSRGGDPIAAFKGMIGYSVQSAQSEVGELLSGPAAFSSSSANSVYQWVDENGNTQFGSAPPEGTDFSTTTYTNNANQSTEIDPAVIAEYRRTKESMKEHRTRRRVRQVLY